MELKISYQESLSKCFKTVFLLTGDAALAEAAVIDAINQDDTDQMPSAGFLRCYFLLAARMVRFSAPGELDLLSSRFPHELRQVLRLRDDLRHSFVLRTLVGLPPEECADLLGVTPQCVNERAVTAARELSGIPNSAARAPRGGRALNN